MRAFATALAWGAALAALSSPAAPAGFDYQHQVGLVVVERIGSPYLIIPNADVAPGTAVSIVDLSHPVKVVSGTVGKALPSPCPAAQNSMKTGTCYTVSVPPDARLHWGPHIAVLAPSDKFTLQPTGAEADLEGSGPSITFRVCAKKEGLQFTVWRGSPLTGKRVWHLYYDLGFKVDTTCLPEDTR